MYVCHYMHTYYHGDQKIDPLKVELQTGVSLPVGARI